MSANILESFVNEVGPIFCLDIGSGTQDGLLALPNLNQDNWPRFVLPSPQYQIARKIEEQTHNSKDIFLYGENMGGGFSSALKNHLKQGLRVYATPKASQAIHDNIDKVQSLGVILSDSAPKKAIPIHLTDYSPEFWLSFFQSLGLKAPHLVLASAQDHGFCLKGNRHFRMQMWQDLLNHDPNPCNWITDHPRPELTRLETLHQATGGYVSDTGTSAILAFLCEFAILERSFTTGLTLLNIGNTHVLAALVFRGQICGLYEHHTELVTPQSLAHDLEEFRLGWLPSEAVQQALGHGTAYGSRPPEAEGFMPTYITGPRRAEFSKLGKIINPGGAMMIAGCFGLLWGLAKQQS